MENRSHINTHNTRINNELFGCIIIAVAIFVVIFIIFTCYHKPRLIIIDSNSNIRYIYDFNNINLVNNDKIYHENCSICLEQFENNDLIQINCGHIFHKKCLKKWTNTNKKRLMSVRCPLCNYKYLHYNIQV